MLLLRLFTVKTRGNQTTSKNAKSMFDWASSGQLANRTPVKQVSKSVSLSTLRNLSQS